VILESLQNQSGGNNDAGLKRTFYIGLHNQVATWPTKAVAPATYAAVVTNDAAVAMTSGNQMYELELTVDKGSSLVTTSQGSKGSLSAKNDLKGVQAKVSASMAGWLEHHKNDELIGITSDLDGQLRFHGAEDLPLMMESFEIQGGGQVGEDRMVTFTLASVGRISSFYGTVAAPLAIPLTPAI